MLHFVIVGGSDGGISAALRARELDRSCALSLVLADRFPNFSICGIPYFLSGEVAQANELAHRQAADIEAQGIRLLLEHRAVRIDPDARLVDVQRPDGGLTPLPYDRLLLGTGAVSIQPRLPGADLPGVFPLRWMGDTLKLAAFLDARPETTLGAAAGVAIGRSGAFKVSRRMETNLPDVYAAGDCVETWHRVTGTHTYLPLGTTSHKQGRIAGENAVGGAREFQGSVGTQSVRLFDLVAARTGLHDADARAAGLAPLSVDSEHWDHKVYYPGAKRMLIRVTGEVSTGRLLGAQIIGAYGTEVSKRVDIVAAALHQDMRVDDLNDLDLSYTPPLSSPWDPVQMAAQAWVQRWREIEA